MHTGDVVKVTMGFVLCGYTAIRNDMDSGKGGGVATFIKNGVSYNIIYKGRDQESIVIKVWTGRDSLIITNYYNPCNRLNYGK